MDRARVLWARSALQVKPVESENRCLDWMAWLEVFRCRKRTEGTGASSGVALEEVT